MAKLYKDTIRDSVAGIEKVIDSIEEGLVDIQDITKSIAEENVSDEDNLKLGNIEEIVNKLLYELR